MVVQERIDNGQPRVVFDNTVVGHCATALISAVAHLPRKIRHEV
jgi:hypothetical protein